MSPLLASMVEPAALRHIGLSEFTEREGRSEAIARGNVLGEGEVTIEAEGIGEPHLQRRRVEDAHIFRLLEIASLRFVKRVVDKV